MSDDTYTNKLAVAGNDKEVLRQLLAEIDANVLEIDAKFDEAAIAIKRLQESQSSSEVVQPLIDAANGMIGPLRAAMTRAHEKADAFHVQYDPLVQSREIR